MKIVEDKLLFPLDKSNKSIIKKMKRPLAIVITLLLVFALIIGLVIFIIPQLSDSIETLVSSIPEYLKSLEAMMNNYTASVDIFNEVWNQILTMWKDILQVLGQVTGTLVTQVLSITIGVTSSIINFFIGMILAIYMLASKEKLVLQIKKIMYAFMKKHFVDKAIEIGKIANFKFSKFIAGQCTEAVIIGILCFVGMLIFSMPYPLLVSVIIGVTALIPIFGAFVGTIPAVFIIFMYSPITAFWFIILIIVIQQIEGNLIYPRVVGNSIGLSALWVMFAMMVGGSLFGILGMLIGIPLFGVAYTVFGTVVNEKLIEKKIQVSCNEDNLEEDETIEDTSKNEEE